MLTVRRSAERGHADHGWLDTYHTFSFADYYDTDFMSFGPLRVLNQDRVREGRGFGTHGHQDMEIISYVLEGSLEHKDSMGNGSAIGPGDVQVMSAGSGITHSEFNGSKTSALHFLQMWVMPRSLGTAPRYDERHFSVEERRGSFRLLVSPDGRDDSLVLDQDAWLFSTLLEAGERTSHTIASGNKAWLHVASGRIELNGSTLEAGDGAAIVAESVLTVRGVEDAEVLLWEVVADD